MPENIKALTPIAMGAIGAVVVALGCGVGYVTIRGAGQLSDQQFASSMSLAGGAITVGSAVFAGSFGLAKSTKD